MLCLLVLPSCREGITGVEEPIVPVAEIEQAKPEEDITQIKQVRGTVDDKRWTKKYDTHFRKNSKRFFGVGFNWKWWKSQSITESALNEKAESWVHAKGLMQVMPGTYGDIQKKLSGLGDIWDPRWNVAAGIYYDHYLYKSWKAERPFVDRMAFTFASYNGGMGNVLKAQKLCNSEKDWNCNLWHSITLYAPYVSSWRHEESLHYVKKINKLMINYIEESS